MDYCTKGQEQKSFHPSPDGESKLFDILAGVLQGDTLAPYLFAIVIDHCMRKAVKVRKGKTWAALHRLNNIWKSKLSKKIKIRLFIAACESVRWSHCTAQKPGQ